MKTLTQLLKSMLLLCIAFSFKTTMAQSISGDTIACNGSYKYYTFPTIDSLDYSWVVTTGGSVVSAHGDSLEVIWTTNSQGIISLTEKYADTIVNQYNLEVSLFPLPDPYIIPSFISNCKTLKITDGPEENEDFKNSECFAVCDSMAMSYYARGNANSTYTWEVLGIFDTLYWENDSIGVVWTQPGNGLVTLTETTVQGCEQLVSFCLDVQERPNAQFEINNPSAVGNILEVCKGQEVQFTNTTILDNNAADIGWYVNGVFVATGPYPFINFDEAGSYEIAMIVNTECNCADTAIAQVIVSNLPVADLECPGIICQGDSATYYTNTNCNPYNFYVIGSTNYTVNGNEISVIWDDVPATGYGQIILDGSSCEDVCPDSTIIDIPVITPNALITGPQTVCSQSDHLNYYVPFWPGTFYEWTIVSQNGNAQLFNETSSEVSLQVNGTVGEILLQVEYYNDLLDCGGVSTIAISISEELDLIGPKVVCANKPFTFDAIPDTSSNPYTWYIDADEQLGQPTPSFTQTITTPGEYLVIVENSDYCNRAGRGLLVVEVPPSPIEIVGEDTICLDNYYTYSTQTTHPDYYIEWMLIDGTDTIIDQGTSIGYKFNSNGPYQVIARQYNVNNPNCSSADLILDIYRETPFDIEILGKDTVCANFTDKYTSNLVDGKDYVWTISNSNIGSLFNATSDSVRVQWNNITNPIDVFLYLQATSCGNTVRDTLAIHVSPGPQPNIEMTGDLCVGEIINFEETNINTGTFTWSTSPTATILTNNANNFDVRYNTPGTHFVSVEVENPNGCIVIVEDVISFDINPEPVANISLAEGKVRYCIDSIGLIYARLVRTSQDDSLYSYNWVRNGLTMPGTTNQDFIDITNSNVGLDSTQVGCSTFQLLVTDTSTGCSELSNIIRVCIDSCLACISSPVYPLPTISRVCNEVEFSGTSSHPQFQVGELYWNINYPDSDPVYRFHTNGPFNFTYDHSGIYTIQTRVLFYENNGTVITDSSNTCFRDTLFKVVVPIIPDFDYTFACDANNQMEVNFTDISNFVAGYTIVTASNWWIYDSLNNLVNGGINTVNLPTTLPSGDYTITLCKEANYNDGNIILTGDSCCITKTIHVPKPAEADFSFMPSPVCEGTPVSFTDESEGDIIRWEWDYGDGSSSLLQNSVRTYDEATTVQPNRVFLTIKDKYGCVNEDFSDITVNPDNFYQVITGDSIACYGDKVILETIIDIEDENYNSQYATTPISYQWSTGGTADTIHVTETGNYSVELVDNFGCIETATFPVLFFNTPAPTIIAPSHVCTNEDFTLQGPQNVGSLSYLWEHSTDTMNWDSLSINSTYYGTGGQNAQSIGSNPFTWAANQTHYIRLVINTTIAGVLGCPDTSKVFLLEVYAPLPEPEIVVDYNCTLPVNMYFANLNDYAAPDYHWSTGAVNQDSIVAGFTGLYGISLRDSFGCTTRGTFDFVALPILNDLSCGCVEICDTLLPAQVNTHVTTDQNWTLLYNGNAIDSGYGIENLILNLNNTSESGTYSMAISGIYYGAFCTDTLEDFLDLIVLDCCPDSVWATIDFVEDTVCNNTIPFIDIDFNFNAAIGVPIFDFYGEVDSTALDDGKLNCYDELGENIVPVDFGQLSDTLISIYVIPHNGDSLGNATCIGDTVWASVYFEPCSGCDSLALAPQIDYYYSNGIVYVDDESEGAYGYHLVEMWYNGQYYSGAPHSTAKFELENINECDTLFYTISYFLDDICCTATCYEYICLDCEDIDTTINVQSSLHGNTWSLTFNAPFNPTYLSWTFPDGTQQAGNVSTNPNIMFPNYDDYNGAGGEVCVIASIKLGLDTADCGTIYTQCCNVEYCFDLNSDEWYSCEELYGVIGVDSYINPDGNHSFTLTPDYLFNLPNVNISNVYWYFGDGNSSNTQNPNHSYLCSSIGDTAYYGAVTFTIGVYHDGIYSECELGIPFYVPVSQCGSSAQAKIYPNPASNIINISFTDIDVSETSYSVYSDIGKVMYEKQHVSQAIEQLDIATWSRGVYTIMIRDKKENYMKKFIKK